jgi:hypothetical protein
MAKSKKEHAYDVKRPDSPARTPQAREDQIIAMAYDAVEQRIANGTATGPELVHFLRMGSPKGKLEKEILEREKQLLEAKTAQIESQKNVEELYAKAIEAMKSYGSGTDE